MLTSCSGGAGETSAQTASPTAAPTVAETIAQAAADLPPSSTGLAQLCGQIPLEGLAAAAGTPVIFNGVLPDLRIEGANPQGVCMWEGQIMWEEQGDEQGTLGGLEALRWQATIDQITSSVRQLEPVVRWSVNGHEVAYVRGFPRDLGVVDLGDGVVLQLQFGEVFNTPEKWEQVLTLLVESFWAE